ncbi:sugar transferase [Sporichthya brevicatena]|uniref:Sugar transferase n=1 Tax=Sporichthya brevicatena TaxID=171442 RepID=A0ABN1GWH6_9ACTN
MSVLTGHGLPEMRRPVDDLTLDLAPPVPTPARTRRHEWQTTYTAFSVLIDITAALAAAGLALGLRFGEATPPLYVAGSLALAPLWVLLVTVSRAYEHRFIGVGTEACRRVFHAGVGMMATVAFVSYAFKAQISRGWVVMAIPGAVALSLLGRAAQRAWLNRQRASDRCVQRTLLIGSPSAVRWTLDRLRADKTHGMDVVGACLSEGDPSDLFDTGLQAYGDLNDIVDAVAKSDAEVVTVLASARLDGDDLRRLSWRLEALGTELVVCSGLTEISGARVTIRSAGHSPMLQVAHARLSGPSRVIKGVFDRVGALVGIVLISPIVVPVALAVWAQDRKNPFFRQTRVGLNGREFRMWKLRTMCVDAEERKAELLPLNEADGALFKIADDPRITPIGKWLRKYSIDELPQLINVLRGEMSLVGPRPPLPDEVNTYGHDMRRRLLVKPGMTGLWQVSGRSQLSWVETEQLDIRYVENWSLTYDLAILWRTVRAVVAGTGAH